MLAEESVYEGRCRDVGEGFQSECRGRGDRTENREEEEKSEIVLYEVRTISFCLLAYADNLLSDNPDTTWEASRIS